MKQSRQNDEKSRDGRTVSAHGKKQRNMKRYMLNKLVIVFGLVSLALFALAVYIVFLINGSHDDYSVEVLSQYGYTSSAIQAKRGDIVDRNGTKIATSEASYILILDPKIILYSDEYTDKTIEAVAETFDLDEDDVREAVTENPESSYLRYSGKTLLSYDAVAEFENYQTKWNNGTYKDASGNAMTAEEKNTKIKGVWFEVEYERNYPFSDLASKVIGFTTSDGADGLWGLENYYNDELSGENGRTISYIDEDYDLEQQVYEATDGATIVSTIDMAAQTIIQRNVDAYMEEVGAANVGVILMNPQNGEIYAMATNTEYDLNNPTDLSLYYEEDEIDAMSDEEREKAWNQMWRNFCISDSYEPGSTAKVLTISAALEENDVTLDSTFVCDGYEIRGGWRINCANTEGHGKETLAEALANSCNDALMQIGALVGGSDLVKYQRIFNLGQSTGIDLPGEETCEGLLYTEDQMKEAEIATTSFGQGYNVTMIQQMSAIASVINGGYYYEPHLVKEIRDSDGTLIETKDPVLVRQTVSAGTSETMRELMVGVVENGTGNTARIAGYELGGKTGAAEKLPRGTGKFVVSFISFVNPSNPNLMLYVVIDEPNVEDQSSSGIAQFLAREIWTDLLPYYNIYPDESLLKEGEEIGDTTDNPYVSDAFDTGWVIIVDPDNMPEEDEEEDEEEDAESEEEAAEASPGEAEQDGNENDGSGQENPDGSEAPVSNDAETSETADEGSPPVEESPPEEEIPVEEEISAEEENPQEEYPPEEENPPDEEEEPEEVSD